ncbi:MAG TPA: hypothetical protein VF278_07025 [Pirellulales bacterium]
MNYADVLAVLFVGAICGSYFGLTCGWQIAVESAQAVAGQVPYPADNPFYMYHVKSWTLLHQLPALLLKCGVSESVLSMAIACVAAAVFQQALGLICYALCRDRLVACAVPLLYVATNVCKGCGEVYPLFVLPDEYWTTYGVSGTAGTLFAWSLWGLGLRRTAAFLSGVAPAVHPALGSWCVAMAAVAILWNGQMRKQPFGATARWFMAGAALAAVSCMTQQYIARGLPAVDRALCQQLLAAFVEGWDNHRVPFPMTSVDCQFGWCLLLIGSVARLWFSAKLPRQGRLLLDIVLVSTAASLALCGLTHVSHWLPMTVMMAMPGRFINLAVVVYPAVLIGLLVRLRRAWAIDCLLAGLALYCLLRTLMLSKQLIYVPTAPKVFVASGLILGYLMACGDEGAKSRLARLIRYGTLACLSLCGYLWMRDLHLAILLWTSAAFLAVFFRQRRIAPEAPADSSLRKKSGRRVGLSPEFLRILLQTPRARRILGIATVACFWLAFVVKGGALLGLGCLLAIGWIPLGWRDALALSLGKKQRDGLGRPSSKNLFVAFAAAASLTLISLPLLERAKAGAAIFRAAEADAVVVAARRESGMLLVVPRMCLVQLRTRRPVLLNGEAMNQITYVPQSGPSMNAIVKGVYGDDILRPRPSWWQNWGGLMMHSGYDLWQAREPAEWRRLSREFGFTQIVTGREWKLRLPVVARSEKLVLYDVR